MLVRNRSMVAHPGVAFDLDLLAAFADDGSRHPTAVSQLGIGGVNDGVHHFIGQVTVDQTHDLTGGEIVFCDDCGH